MMIRKAVVPIAGLGTRLFPASHACKKAFFPIVGPDGIARALLHYHIIDLIEAGIEQICIIVRPGEEQLVVDYFQGPGETYLKRLDKHPALVSEAARHAGCIGAGSSSPCRNSRRVLGTLSTRAKSLPQVSPFCFAWEIIFSGGKASRVTPN